MALGGGTWVSQNKVLPGSYINVFSRRTASAQISDRGIAAAPFGFDYSPAGVFAVTASDLEKNSKALFGCAYGDEKIKPVRDILKNARLVYLYNTKGGLGAKKASNTYAEAINAGRGGNNFKITVENAVDGGFIVKTLLGSTVVDEQTAQAAKDLKPNAYVTFKTGAELAENTAGESLTNGADGEEDYQAALDLLESYSFNTLCCASSDATTKKLFISYTNRMRDEVGKKFQTVVHQAEKPDSFGIINLKNEGETAGEGYANGAVFWLTGAEAGCAVNRSLINATYDGEYEQKADYTQAELEAALKAGEFVFHKNIDVISVLDDINSFVTFTEDMSEDFASNQTIRVLDQLANDDALIFNTKYLGKIQNDESGRISLWNDFGNIRRQLLAQRAIEDFDAVRDLTVEAGEKRDSVVASGSIKPVNAMKILYATVYVD